MILGDSMIKNIKGWEISKKLQNASVYSRYFSGAKVCCMKEYLKPSWKPRSFCSSCRYKWCGFWPVTRSYCKINSLCCIQFKNRQVWCDDVTISNIITRNDCFIAKPNEVNKCLTELCFERNFLLIDHSKTLK